MLYLVMSTNDIFFFRIHKTKTTHYKVPPLTYIYRAWPASSGADWDTVVGAISVHPMFVLLLYSYCIVLLFV